MAPIVLLIPLLALAGAGPPGGKPATTAWGVCADCHEQVAAPFARSTHGRLKSWEVRGGEVGCAACHGDPTQHLDTGDVEGLVRFTGDPAGDSAACLTCHASRGAEEWSAAAHAHQLACTECHSIHTVKAPTSTCASCHQEVQALMLLPSHHPVKEGKMTCASCHNVHRANPGALRTEGRLNDLCFTCHQAQEGPFIFQHAPVEEDCTICHTPHGSVADNLLVANDPVICLQCHSFHFHMGKKPVDTAGTVIVGGKPYPNVLGKYGYSMSFGTKCTQCHTKVHGSDLPSQGITSQGRNLTR
ncbi:MAG: DmsE family decaheme c-type cytochrome [Acidobacteriota bacterium]|jgi:DmsE family decaheme c-type cytochrome